MDTFEIQRKIFTIAAVLLIISALSMAAIIPAMLLEPIPDFLPVQSAFGALLGIGIHLYLAYWFGIRLRRRRTKIRNEIYFLSAFGLIVLGFMIMDGAFAFLDQVLYVSIGMFLCVVCDFAAALVFVTAIFLLWTKKKK